MQRGRAPLDLEPAGQDALALAAALHACLHRLPDRGDALLDLVLGDVGLLVLEHQRRDAHPVLVREPQQIVGGVERVRNGDVIGGRAAIRGRTRLIDDEDNTPNRLLPEGYEEE